MSRSVRTSTSALLSMLALAGCTSPPTAEQMTSGASLFLEPDRPLELAEPMRMIQTEGIDYSTLYQAAAEAGLSAGYGLRRHHGEAGHVAAPGPHSDPRAGGVRSHAEPAGCIYVAAAEGRDSGDEIAFTHDDLEKLAPALLNSIGLGEGTVPVVDEDSGEMVLRPRYLAQQDTRVWGDRAGVPRGLLRRQVRGSSGNSVLEARAELLHRQRHHHRHS